MRYANGARESESEQLLLKSNPTHCFPDSNCIMFIFHSHRENSSHGNPIFPPRKSSYPDCPNTQMPVMWNRRQKAVTNLFSRQTKSGCRSSKCPFLSRESVTWERERVCYCYYCRQTIIPESWSMNTSWEMETICLLHTPAVYGE